MASLGLSPEQITDMISSVSSPVPLAPRAEPEMEVIERGPTEIWASSKREKLALFIRSYFAEDLWFNARDILEQQVIISGALPLGDTSAIGTYLTRLYETGHLDRKKGGARSIHYRMTEKLCSEYPLISTVSLEELMIQTVN